MQANSKQKRKVQYLNSEAMALDVLERVSTHHQDDFLCLAQVCAPGLEPRGKFMLIDATAEAKVALLRCQAR